LYFLFYELVPGFSGFIQEPALGRPADVVFVAWTLAPTVLALFPVCVSFAKLVGKRRFAELLNVEKEILGGLFDLSLKMREKTVRVGEAMETLDSYQD